MPEFDKKRQYPNITYFHVPIRDSKTCTGRHASRIDYQRIFRDLTGLIDQLLKLPGNTLVHCKRGHHRSAAVVAAYLVRFRGMTYDQAINYIKKFRPFALRKTSCIMNELYKFCLPYVK